MTTRGNRKYTAFILSLSAYVLLMIFIVVFTVNADVAGIAIALSTGITGISAAFYAGNALTHRWTSKQDEIKNEKQEPTHS